MWQELHAALEQEKATLAANATAATLVLGRPMLSDEDDVLTRRRGALTTPVVLLRSVTTGSGGFVFVVGLDGSRAEINEREWRKASAQFLHHWLVRTPRWMVPVDSQKPQSDEACRPASQSDREPRALECVLRPDEAHAPAKTTFHWSRSSPQSR